MIPFTGYEVLGGFALILLLSSIYPYIDDMKIYFKEHR